MKFTNAIVHVEHARQRLCATLFYARKNLSEGVIPGMKFALCGAVNQVMQCISDPVRERLPFLRAIIDRSQKYLLVTHALVEPVF